MRINHPNHIFSPKYGVCAVSLYLYQGPVTTITSNKTRTQDLLNISHAFFAIRPIQLDYEPFGVYSRLGYFSLWDLSRNMIQVCADSKDS